MFQSTTRTMIPCVISSNSIVVICVPASKGILCGRQLYIGMSVILNSVLLYLLYLLIKMVIIDNFSKAIEVKYIPKIV